MSRAPGTYQRPATLREWRKAAGKSVTECCRIVGCSRVAWHDWEAGRRVPRELFRDRIFELTGGQVLPASFLPLPKVAA